MAMIVKSFRVDPELWLWVVGRAAQKRITASAWLVRMLEDARQRLEVMPTDGRPAPKPQHAETRPAHPVTPAPAARLSIDDVRPAITPGSRLKKR